LGGEPRGRARRPGRRGKKTKEKRLEENSYSQQHYYGNENVGGKVKRVGRTWKPVHNL